jgi:predicted dithiol-disulfide oxidoreductase (DUF899 family)
MSSATVDSQQKETTITLPCIASRDEWLQARLKLLTQEKEIMRAQDAVTAQRRELYGRGAEVMLSTYHYLDLTLLGRQRYVNEFPSHDAYNAAVG